jgi:hypothetical protein
MTGVLSCQRLFKHFAGRELNEAPTPPYWQSPQPIHLESEIADHAAAPLVIAFGQEEPRAPSFLTLLHREVGISEHTASMRSGPSRTQKSVLRGFKLWPGQSAGRQKEKGSTTESLSCGNVVVSPGATLLLHRAAEKKSEARAIFGSKYQIFHLGWLGYEKEIAFLVPGAQRCLCCDGILTPNGLC